MSGHCTSMISHIICHRPGINIFPRIWLFLPEIGSCPHIQPTSPTVVVLKVSVIIAGLYGLCLMHHPTVPFSPPPYPTSGHWKYYWFVDKVENYYSEPVEVVDDGWQAHSLTISIRILNLNFPLDWIHQTEWSLTPTSPGCPAATSPGPRSGRSSLSQSSPAPLRCDPLSSHHLLHPGWDHHSSAPSNLHLSPRILHPAVILHSPNPPTRHHGSEARLERCFVFIEVKHYLLLSQSTIWLVRSV